ncbi:MAG: hypothetical protein ACXVPU_18120 [Bacteroidia bacterium]
MLKNKFSILNILLFMLFAKSASAMTVDLKDSIVEIHTELVDTIYLQNDFPEADSILHKKNSAKENTRKKVISAIFAFPFPFGFMGAHRVMLGTSPWVPVVYVATFGGCFGLLPLIDFCVITFSKDIEQYENNPHVFMWVK